MTVDRVCITMPDTPREFFIAMCCVQDYLFQYAQEVAGRVRDPICHFTFRMRDCYEAYELPLKSIKDFTPDFDYTGWTLKKRSEYSCFIDFDPQAFAIAEKYAACTGKHITEALGVAIGASPRRWPILPILDADERVIIDAWGGGSQALELKEQLPNSTVFDRSSNSMEDILALEIDKVSAVIGPSSAITYLAAAYRRKVVEIFPNVRSYQHYNNEGIPCYQALIGNPNAGQVLQAWQVVSEESVYI
jgi:hypothetical protein